MGPPGSGVDHGEPPADGVVREVSEETGYDVRVVRLLGVCSNVWHPRSHDYQRDLRDMEASGRIRVTDVRPLGFSPCMFHRAV